RSMTIYMEPPPIWWVRFKPGVVGLTRRTTHALPVPAGFPETLTACCGQIFRKGEGNAEIVTPGTGQPSSLCLQRLPLPAQPLQLPGSEPLALLAGTGSRDDG